MPSAPKSERVPAVSSGEPARTPRLLGRYEILHPIATGGMALLHLARMRGIEGFERLVVLKQLRPELTQNPELVSMFLDEARLLAGMSHSNIVHIYDVGALPDGGYFHAMEYLHGQTVRKIIRRARERGEKWVPLEQALYIVNAILAGLHYVHERRGPDGEPLHIVHRDVAPDNVIVTYDGEVKLLDFGIAKADSQTTTTQAGVLKGKVRYMSPEQCRGEPIDRRSDIFSTGILLWMLTTGRRLYGGGNDLNTLFEIVERAAPPPSALRDDYPPELESIVMRALERDKERRYQTAREMQLDLEAFAREQKISMSAASMASFMEGHFAGELLSWREAQREGKDLAAHVVEQLDEAPPSTLGRDISHPSGHSQGSYSSGPKLISAPAPLLRRRPLVTAAGIAFAVFCVVGGGLSLAFRRIGPEPSSSAAGSATAVTAVTAVTTVVPSATPTAGTSADAAPALSPSSASSPDAATPSSSHAGAPGAPQALHSARPASSTKPGPTASAEAPPPTAKPTAWDKDSPLPPP